MKATVESTNQMHLREGGPNGRLWEGITEGGVKFVLVVSGIAVLNGSDTSEFGDELIGAVEVAVHMAGPPEFVQ